MGARFAGVELECVEYAKGRMDLVEQGHVPIAFHDIGLGDAVGFVVLMVRVVEGLMLSFKALN
jgi:hypothetical protein